MKRIPPFSLIAKPLNTDASTLPKFKWAGEGVGCRHKLGGEPDFLQESDWPICNSCSERMTFYAQLDSINDEFCLADCGLLYVFVCFDCFEVHSLIQSY